MTAGEFRRVAPGLPHPSLVRALRALVTALLASGLATAGLAAQALDGPPPPIAPAVISRDATGYATLRAVSIALPLKLDGKLDEEVYRTTEAISNFTQVEPN